MNPGNTASHHAVMSERASFNTLPHVTVVGGTPKPRNESCASVKIADATPNAADTNTGASEFGNTCRKMIRAFESPSAVAAEVYSVFLILRNSPRVNRAIPVQPVNPIMIITSQIEPVGII